MHSKRIWRILYCVLMFILLFGHNVASAQSNNGNIDAKLIEPIATPYGMLGVESTKTLGHLQTYAQLASNYGKDLIVLRNRAGIFSRPIAHRVTTELAFGIGIVKQFDLSVSLPLFLRQFHQDGGSTDLSGESGVGDLRFSFKWQALQNERFGGFGLALHATFGLPTGIEQKMMRGVAFAITPGILMDLRLDNGFVLAFNASFRWKNGNEVLVDHVAGSEFRIGIAGEMPLFRREFSVIGEFFSVISLGDSSLIKQLPPDRPFNFDAPSEGRFALRWRHYSGVSITGGVGVGVSAGVGSPDIRVMLGIGYHIGGYDDLAKARDLRLAEERRRNERPVDRKPPPERRKPQIKEVKPKFEKVKTPTLVASRKLSKDAFDKAVKSDPDPDGDGIPYPYDKCPLVAEDFDKFQDKDGCPDNDNDRDGINDKEDKCPLQPETINGNKDDDGCPDEGQGKVTITGNTIKINEKVYFNSGSDRLKQRSFALLRQVAAFIKARWQLRKIRIEGHTDSRGHPEMNVDLSVRRAQRVKSFLVQEGVAGRRLVVKGYGFKKPIATNRTSKGRAANRRVAFEVLEIFRPKKAKR